MSFFTFHYSYFPLKQQSGSNQTPLYQFLSLSSSPSLSLPRHSWLLHQEKSSAKYIYALCGAAQQHCCQMEKFWQPHFWGLQPAMLLPCSKMQPFCRLCLLNTHGTVYNHIAAVQPMCLRVEWSRREVSPVVRVCNITL